jgi:hypothetical protein
MSGSIIVVSFVKVEERLMPFRAKVKRLFLLSTNKVWHETMPNLPKVYLRRFPFAPLKRLRASDNCRFNFRDRKSVSPRTGLVSRLAAGLLGLRRALARVNLC